MSSDKNFFEVNPPPELDQKIEALSIKALAENRKLRQRRQFMQWFFVPALAFASLLLTWRSLRSKQAPNLGLLEFAEWTSNDGQDFELVSELDFVENLENLENWEDT